MKKLSFLAIILALACACNTRSYDSILGGDTPDVVGDPEYGDKGATSDGEYIDNGGSGTGDDDGQSHAGRVTAAEWRDLDNWLFWSNLMTTPQADQSGTDYTQFSGYWGFYTNNRVAVRITDDAGKPQRDIPVSLVRTAPAGSGQTVIYNARTDNRGETNLWIGLTQLQQSVETESLALTVNGVKQTQPVSVTHWGEEPQWNTFTASVSATQAIDIAFIVDATGSMTDEIAFLKADLTDIIGKVRNNHADADIRTAALFYRDEGDDYLTRESDFNKDISVTTAFIRKQDADGGGDYPEAVHTALEAGLQKLSWSESNAIRLTFMLLDAPPHKQDDVLASLHRSIPVYAEHGIRIIPVAASGVDKPTEFFLRFAAIATDGTYVFLTNDSGIGGDHIAATVGEYNVELLNDLIVRLIDQYLQ